LLVLALWGIKQNLGSSPLILYTCDLIGHNFPQMFYQLNGNSLPPDPAVSAMQAFTDKTVAFVTAQIRANIGNIPVLFAVGNIDSYTGEGPDSVLLSNNAGSFYSQFLGEVLPTKQRFSAPSGLADIIPPRRLAQKWLVIGLNTNPFSPLVQGNIPPNNNDAPVDAELTWLDSIRASAQASGQKVWLLIHVPPGALTVTTASNADSNGHITAATASMMWE
jgi:sphingomyelin phosphodiesterase acid-like 3